MEDDQKFSPWLVILVGGLLVVVLWVLIAKGMLWVWEWAAQE